MKVFSKAIQSLGASLVFGERLKSHLYFRRDRLSRRLMVPPDVEELLTELEPAE
jgi:hypothetical protein